MNCVGRHRQNCELWRVVKTLSSKIGLADCLLRIWGNGKLDLLLPGGGRSPRNHTFEDLRCAEARKPSHSKRLCFSCEHPSSLRAHILQRHEGSSARRSEDAEYETLLLFHFLVATLGLSWLL